MYTHGTSASMYNERMPFTLAHPAAVIPLRRARLPFAALVCGSIAPDMGYFFSPGTFFLADAHTFVRGFTFCLPAGLALLCLFTLLRRGIVRMLPTALAGVVNELCEPNPWRPVRLPHTLLAVLLGVWTHLFWDSWTHFNGYFVRTFPVLATPLLGVNFDRWLQHFSTLLGFLALYLFCSAVARKRGEPIEWRFSARAAAWCAAAVAAGVFTFLSWNTPWNVSLSAGDARTSYLVVVSFTRACFVLGIFASLVLVRSRRTY
jgi:hypothetical protein